MALSGIDERFIETIRVDSITQAGKEWHRHWHSDDGNAIKRHVYYHLSCLGKMLILRY